jgi:HEAT repeat protein
MDSSSRANALTEFQGFITVLVPALLTGSILFCSQFASHAAEQKSEDQLIQIVQSDASPHEKDAACARLKRVGTAACVPALAALLADEQLSHSARYALESMASPEAGAALVRALDSTAGLTRVGIIDSLAVRREAQAVPALTKLLAANLDKETESAAYALGEIATPDAVRALEAAQRASSGPSHDASLDALLRSATSWLASGKHADAQALFQRVYAAQTNEPVRIAAWTGVLRAAGSDAQALFTQSLIGPTGPSRTAALQLVREANFPNAGQAFANLLPKVSSQVQVGLIEGLAMRGDTVAAAAIGTLASNSRGVVRIAALKALGPLGNDSAVSILAEAAASGNADEQAAAREALVELHRGIPTDVLLALLTSSNPKVQAELARALGHRSDYVAVPKLLQLARTDSGSGRQAALQALSTLANLQDLPALVQLVVGGRTDTARAEAAETLSTALQRLQAKDQRVDIAPVAKAFEESPPAVRISLLSVCSGLSDPRTRQILQTSIADPDPGVRSAAVHALCDTRDLELLPDVLKIARTAPEENFHGLATAACVRLTSQEEGAKLSNAARLAPLKELLSGNPSAAQKRMILAGLAEISDPEALALSAPLLDEAGVQAEAARAVIKIAPTIPGTDARATAALKKVIANTTDAATRQAAEAALKQIHARTEFITTWQVAGPYREAGKNYAALFDIAFAPEPGFAGKESADVSWRSLPAGADPARPGVMDLLKALGGEQCVAYARTRIHSDQKQPALLEMGSDDGLRVWLNGKQVHAHNIARPLQPGSDRAIVNLNPGWNDLVLKVTQNNLGWEFCVRVLKPDGSHVDDLQFAGGP